MKIRQAVVFAIIMQNGEGIKTKAPHYISKKLWACENDPHPERILDDENKKIYDEYIELWSSHMINEGIKMDYTEQEKQMQVKLITQAKQHITEDPPDYHLANFVLRDSPIVKKTKDLSDLSWTMHQEGNVSESDVLWLIELIEKEMQKEDN